MIKGIFNMAGNVHSTRYNHEAHIFPQLACCNMPLHHMNSPCPGEAIQKDSTVGFTIDTPCIL